MDLFYKQVDGGKEYGHTLYKIYIKYISNNFLQLITKFKLFDTFSLFY